MSREGAGTPLVAEVIKGECGRRRACLNGVSLGHSLCQGHQAVPGIEEIPIPGQKVPLSFRARVHAVSWVWVASQES